MIPKKLLRLKKNYYLKAKVDKGNIDMFLVLGECIERLSESH